MKVIGGFALLPITKQKAPVGEVVCYEAHSLAASEDGEGDDIIEETLKFFRANVFFKNFEVKVPFCLGSVLTRLGRCRSHAHVPYVVHIASIESHYAGIFVASFLMFSAIPKTAF